METSIKALILAATYGYPPAQSVQALTAAMRSQIPFSETQIYPFSRLPSECSIGCRGHSGLERGIPLEFLDNRGLCARGRRGRRRLSGENISKGAIKDMYKKKESESTLYFRSRCASVPSVSCSMGASIKGSSI